MAKANKPEVTRFKLTKTQKLIVEQYTTGKLGLDVTAARLGMTKQRVYTMLAHIMRHSTKIGRINIEEVLKDY